jgi:hypothetical protein
MLLRRIQQVQLVEEQDAVCCSKKYGIQFSGVRYALRQNFRERNSKLGGQDAYERRFS